MTERKFWLLGVAALAVAMMAGCGGDEKKPETCPDKRDFCGDAQECCASNMRCRETGIVRCVSKCNNGTGCASGETCSDQGVCQKALCKDMTAPCADGQVCVTQSAPTTQSAAGNKCGCIPDLPATTDVYDDSCAAYGQVCGFVTGGAPAACRTPKSGERCDPDHATPCESGLNCLDFNGGLSTPLYLCLKPCTSTTECDSIFQKCWTEVPDNLPATWEGHCMDAICGPAYDGAKFFGACQRDEAGDGQCYAPNAHISGSTYGFCMPVGTATGECEYMTDDLAKTCGVGQFCMPRTRQYSVSNGQLDALLWKFNDPGQCVTACNAGAAAASTTCAEGEACQQSAILYSQEQSDSWKFGDCRKKCSRDNPGTCGVDAVGNEMSCQPRFDDKNLMDGLCSIAQETVGETYLAGCTVQSNADVRENCGDDLVCLSTQGATTGFCGKWCTHDANTCPLWSSGDVTACDECGVIHVCEATTPACEPQCDGKECGDNGCGGLCGEPLEAGTFCNSNNEVVAVVEAVNCVPDCDGKVCGYDGCGRLCGEPLEEGKVCISNEVVTDNVEEPCALASACDDKVCGHDGCGRLCGEDLVDGTFCSPENTVVQVVEAASCVPHCGSLQECGYDGCGGLCGDPCGQGEACSQITSICRQAFSDDNVWGFCIPNE